MFLWYKCDSTNVLKVVNSFFFFFFFLLLSSRISYILTRNEKHFGKTKNYVATVVGVASGSTVQDRK